MALQLNHALKSIGICIYYEMGVCLNHLKSEKDRNGRAAKTGTIRICISHEMVRNTKTAKPCTIGICISHEIGVSITIWNLR